MVAEVRLSRWVAKKIYKLPFQVKILFEIWVKTIQKEGLKTMQQINGYRDHSLKGTREGQRSSSLNRSWRVIYELNDKDDIIIVEVLEITKHEY